MKDLKGTANRNLNNSKRIFVLNELSLRLSPALASEIGLNESIMLLQIDFWIANAPEANIIQGRKWTYQSVRQMQEKAFSFWSISTINRTANNLINMGLIIEGNYNKMPYDKTRWFTLNFEVLAQLKSIAVSENTVKTGLCHIDTGVDTGLFQNDTRSVQNGTRSNQNETTIPETPTKIPTENTATTTAAAALTSAGEKTATADVTESSESPVQTEPLSEGNPVQSVFPLGVKTLNFAEENFERKLKSFERDTILNWVKQFEKCADPEGIVMSALERCVLAKTDRIDYAETIIQDYLKYSVTTVDDARSLREAWKQQNNRASPSQNYRNEKRKVPNNQILADKYEKCYL